MIRRGLLPCCRSRSTRASRTSKHISLFCTLDAARPMEAHGGCTGCSLVSGVLRFILTIGNRAGSKRRSFGVVRLDRLRDWRLAVALFSLAGILGYQPPAGSASGAPAANVDAGHDGQSFLFDLLDGMPGRQPPLAEPNAVATAPGAEQQARVPTFSFNLLAPLNYTSNAEFLSSGGTRTVEGSPQVRLGFASQIGELPLRLSASTAVEFDRFAKSDSGDFDKIRSNLQIQYVDPTDDQAFSPFFGFTPRLDFTPTFAARFSTRYDLNLGVNKAFNFDEDFHRVPVSDNSSATTVWSFGYTAIVQRRFREPAPASTALAFIPSVTHRLSEDWTCALAFDLEQRWFDTTDGVSQNDFLFEPVGAVEYGVPDRFLGGPDTARWLGHPRVDFFGGIENVWSNVSSGTFNRVFAGFAIRAGWRF